MSPFWHDGEAVFVVVADSRPARFTWHRRIHHVAAISARWRTHVAWWSEREMWRDYWEVTTDSGFLCVLFHDLIDLSWFLERICE
jgi:hypothetical protein